MTDLMSSNSKQVLHYRMFQHIWNTAVNESGEDRTLQACRRCRKRHAKCDGQIPCRRCQRVGVACLYTEREKRPTQRKAKGNEWELNVGAEEVEEARMLEMMQNVLLLEETMNEFGIEIGMWRKNIWTDLQISSDVGTEDNEKDRNSKGRSWVFKLKKNGMRVQTDITNAHELYEFLAHFSGPHTTPRQSTKESTVGTKVMMGSSTVQWPKLHGALLTKAETHTPPSFYTNTATTPTITLELEKAWLEIILVQSVECGSWSQGRFGEQFLAHQQTYRSQSPHYMAHCYAIGAFNALHVLENHLDTIELNIPGNSHEFARAIAKRYFEKGHDLLIEQVLESELEDLSEDLIDALFMMFRYLVDEGPTRYDLAATYLGMALRIAAQLDYHKALRNVPAGAVVDCEALDKAVKWNLLACCDQIFKLVSGLPCHTTFDEIRLNLLDVTVRIPANMPPDRLQRIHETLYNAKHSAICRDYLDALWSDVSPVPTEKDLEPFVAAFARWESELPSTLRIDVHNPTAFASRSCFLLALNFHFQHQIAVINLYHPFFPCVHPDPSALSPKIMRTCSDAAITATHLIFVFARAGACSFPFKDYKITCRVHLLGAENVDGEVKRRNRAAVLRAGRIVRMTKEYRLGKKLAVGLALALKNVVEKLEIAEEEEVEVFGVQEEEWFMPVKMPGVGW